MSTNVPPPITKPKLSSLQRRALNGVVESAQDWLDQNRAAIEAQTATRVDQLAAQLHTWTQTGLTWATAKFKALKF